VNTAIIISDIQDISAFRIGGSLGMDESRIHELARKVGGRFRLASLIQKRLVEINRGQRFLIEEPVRNPLYSVLQEIEQDKITLTDEEQAAEETPSLEATEEEQRTL
jgi:DNA-directed RNA polymerase subunit omega